MKITSLQLDGLVLIQRTVFEDQRGFFLERFKRSDFIAHGVPGDFVQENHSRSQPGVLRGLHYQYSPPQGKLVGVIRGRIWDVAVDIRPDSDTFGQSYGVELNDEDGRMLWIPAGFAHGFCVLGDEPADVLYKTDAEYNGEAEGGILWSDEDLGIDWPVKDPIVSERDRQQPTFAEYSQKPPEWSK